MCAESNSTLSRSGKQDTPQSNTQDLINAYHAVSVWLADLNIQVIRWLRTDGTVSWMVTTSLDYKNAAYFADTYDAFTYALKLTAPRASARGEGATVSNQPQHNPTPEPFDHAYLICLKAGDGFDITQVEAWAFPDWPQNKSFYDCGHTRWHVAYGPFCECDESMALVEQFAARGEGTGE